VATIDVLNAVGATVSVQLPNADGQQNMAGSRPVVIASDQIVPVTLPNMSVSSYSVAGVIPITTDILVIDCQGFEGVSIQCVSMGTQGIVTPGWSNNNVDYVGGTVIAAGGLVVSGGISAAGLYTAPVIARYLRLRMSTATTAVGTTTFSVQGIPQAANFPVPAQTVSGSLTTVSTVTTLANGQTAHSSASTGSPLRVGGRVNTAAETTLVAGDASDLFITTGGAAVVKQYAVPELDWQATSGLTALASTDSTTVRALASATTRNYVTAIQLVNTSSTVSTTVTILDGSTVLWIGFLPATTAALPVVPVNIQFPTPLRGSVNTAVNIQLGTAANVYWNAQGYQAI
jgi:hypothetical protein